MSDQLIVLINGPKRSGKDTAAKWITSSFSKSVRIGFADHLKNATHAAYGLHGISFDHYEHTKDEPSQDFLGISPRRAYISHSESYMKPLHGKQVFSVFFARAAEKSGAAMVVVPDSGFTDEAEYQRSRVGSDNMLLIRAHRPGFGFEGDSRSYIDLPGITTYDVVNDSDVVTYQEKCLALVSQWAFKRIPIR